jgi:hypothetical protein
MGALACRSGRAWRGLDDEQLATAVAVLSRPLPADVAALYRLRTPTSNRLRLTLLTAAEAGRMTVSEPFGAALSISAWDGAGEAVFVDLQAGCRVAGADVSRVLRLDFVPLPEVALLLAGRLPAVAGDQIRVRDDGRLLVAGEGWSCVVTVAPDPWRVVALEEATRSRRRGWRVRLGEHLEAVPRAMRLQLSASRWAEIELTRMEWREAATLPPLPELPPCRVVQ